MARVGRRIKVEREMSGDIVICLDTIQHRLTEPAFLEMMGKALKVLEAIQARQEREATQ